jgi:Galactose oxidase, central domain
MPVWDSYEPTPGDEKPPPRTGHVLISTGDRIILFVRLLPSSSPLVIILYSFGGTNDQCDYNDTWSFDVSTRKWTELQCTGSIPAPRHSHAAALVDDVMYIFGGRCGRCVLGDLIAFKLSSK